MFITSGTFHVSVEKAPSRALMMSEYVASVEPDNISFRNVDTNEHCFQWEFSQVKGLQFKSEFGHLNIEVSKYVCLCTCVFAHLFMLHYTYAHVNKYTVWSSIIIFPVTIAQYGHTVT